MQVRGIKVTKVTRDGFEGELLVSIDPRTVGSARSVGSSSNPVNSRSIEPGTDQIPRSLTPELLEHEESESDPESDQDDDLIHEQWKRKVTSQALTIMASGESISQLIFRKTAPTPTFEEFKQAVNNHECLVRELGTNVEQYQGTRSQCRQSLQERKSQLMQQVFRMWFLVTFLNDQVETIEAYKAKAPPGDAVDWRKLIDFRQMMALSGII